MKTAAKHASFGGAKSITNERRYPYHIQMPVAATGLDIALGRQIMEFHRSRHIQLRYGRPLRTNGQSYYRWCFPDLATARAFVEQFGGALHTHSR
jgi:hypothetical protein